MNKLLTKVARLALGLSLAAGVGVAIGSKKAERTNAAVDPDTEEVSYSLSMKCNSTTSDSSTALSSTTSSDYIATGASYVTSVSSGYCYLGSSTYSALKFGSSSKKGTITFTLASSAQVKATNIVFNFGAFDTGKRVNFSVNGKTSGAGYGYANTPSTKGNFTDYALAWDGETNITSIKVEANGASNFRFYLKSITVYVAKEVDPETPTLSDITSTAHSLSVGDNTGLQLSTTATNRGSNVVSWAASPSAGVSFSGTSASGETTTIKFPTGANALSAGTEVTVTASLTGASSKTYKICAIVNDGTSANPYNAMEAKYKAIDGVTSSTYVQGYITNKFSNTAYWIHTSADGTTKTFEIFGINSSDAKLGYMAVGRYVVAHGTLAYYNNTTPEITSSVLDRVDVVTLANNSLEVNNTQSTTLSVSSTGGDIVWTTTAGSGSVTLSGGSNSSVTITGTSVGTATVTATVGTVHADCTVTVLEYATDWAFKSITLSTGSGFVSSYQQGATFDKTGITVTYTEHSNSLNKDRSFNRTDVATFNFDANKNTVGQFKLTATYDGHTTTDDVMITITAAPGVVHFGSATGAVAITSASNSGEDTFGNDVSVTCTTSGSTPYYSNSATFAQYGSASNPMTSLTITVTFDEKVSIQSFEIQFAGSANAANGSYLAYSTSNDVEYNILSGSCSGSTTLTQSTNNSFEAVNADTLTVAFTGTAAGIKLFYISYSMGTAVEEFGTLSSAVISSTSSHETLFKIDETFSSAGLILTATDTKDFSTDLTTGFTTNYDNHVFTSSDVNNSPLTVTVTLTIGSVTLNNIQYTIEVINPPTYSAVSSQDELYEGMKVIIYGGSNKALGSENSGYFNEATVTFDGDDIDDASNVLEFTVRIYGNLGFALQHGTKYLQYHGSGNNAYLDTTLDTNAVWTFGDDGLVNVGTTTREMRHNSGATRFACYLNTGNSITGTRVSLYLSSATPKTDLLGAETFAQRYLHMRDYDPELHTGVDGSGYCKDNVNHYYSTAKAFYTSASFSSGEKTEFAGLSDAVLRLQNWARANNETFDPSAKTFSSNNVLPLTIITENTNTVAIIVIISMVSVTAIGGYFFIRRRKEN